MATIRTPVTDMLGIKHPVVLAGMNAVAHADLVAAVSNAGGLGVIGGLTFTPKRLRAELEEVKAALDDPDAFMCGVDLAIPQLGNGARKTNHDYTHGKLPQLVDIMIEYKIKLFVSAVGVPPDWMITKLHAAGIPIMNMVGSPRNAEKALDAGVDLICAQGTEGGGHTGEIGTSVLIPQVVDVCKGRMSPLFGTQVQVIAAGGIFDGRGLAMALSLGASAVWVGTRFIASAESAAPQRHIDAVCDAKPTDTTRTLIYSGRPLRTLKTDYVIGWESQRQQEIEELCNKGVVPFNADIKKWEAEGTEYNIAKLYPLLMGQASSAIKTVQTAREIVEEMVAGAAVTMRQTSALVVSGGPRLYGSKL